MRQKPRNLLLIFCQPWKKMINIKKIKEILDENPEKNLIKRRLLRFFVMDFPGKSRKPEA